jgi:hypothetical protein
LTHPQQLGFGFDEMLEAERTAHIPSTMDEAIPCYRRLIEKHNAAMMAGDKDAAMTVRAEVDDLAYQLNGGDSAIKAGPEPRLINWSAPQLQLKESFPSGARPAITPST